MADTGLFRYRNIGIIVILIILAAFSLWIRVLPLFGPHAADILSIVGSDDPLYNLRQIEQILANFPGYSWFEAMTLFPTGQTVPWGPLFTFICSVACLVAGATTRTEIIQAALWVPPILAALMVPVIFVLVRKIWDWKAGLIAAALIAVIGGQFFFRSLAGYLDHHIAEVFFSTIYCIAYLYCLDFCRKSPVDLKVWKTLKIPVLVSCIAGVAYVLGFLTMPTMILFAFITALTTICLFIYEYYHGRHGEYIVVINTVVFGIALLVSLFFLPSSGFALYYYSLGHPISYLLLIVGTIILYALSRFLAGRPWYSYPGIVFALSLIGILIMALALPTLYQTFVEGLTAFFGLSPYTVTIQEARPWTLSEAWAVFNFGLLLMIGGIFALLYKNWKEYRPGHIFVLVWSFFIIIAAFREVRYEYYLAVNIALLGGICVGFALEHAWPDILAMGKKASVKEPEPEQKEVKGSTKKKKADRISQKSTRKAVSKSKINYVNILLAGLACAFALIFAVLSLQQQYAVASSEGIRMNQDWRESLEWMNGNTPETGVDYYTIYEEDNFTYPATAYGVMSWWDYGHMITYLANRIPNSNPFQAGVAGPNGSATFFVSGMESATNQVADNQGTRYVMTDIEMATGKFWAMATWYNATEKQAPYQPTYYIPDPANPGTYQPLTAYKDLYFLTTVSRLHNFDGSYTPAGEVYYIEYTTSIGSRPDQAVITEATVMDADEANAAADRYNQQAQPGTGAAVVSTNFIQPTTDIPALSHYRLVHESPTNVFSGSSPDVKYVKIFEYVPGARIKGEGIIELPLVSNTGRAFVYRQQSTNGEFVVPYSTEGNPYDVRATGKYKITGTGRQISVSEDAIMRGLQIT
ncbi:MAG: oligosaccharyl transferase, archaeosortase A system-associated [Methanoregulaceae archaeon]|mgnify:CR=1 FL=1|jgi:dolichyl-diphosphooligosaccharide--protein glycosyltransferase|nr:oligosaccharyl transferase, archaeosortase A system-associated [Methanoregulaceae archaeon]NLH26499.1 oligosaccharyl transferase, archaeosortase A system-associated [Methanomicrobiales archaeon]HNL85913.1 oligosaccharyl transferase, archaeosortase A system-associated [Methanoregulaceae archaeon]